VGDRVRVISGPFSQMRESIGRLIPLGIQLPAQVPLASQANITGTKTTGSPVRVGQYVPAVIEVGMSIIVCFSSVPRKFFRGGGGVSTNSVEDRRQRKRGSWGGNPLVRGFTQFVIERIPYSD
jgi:hypothetical protein